MNPFSVWRIGMAGSVSAGLHRAFGLLSVAGTAFALAGAAAAAEQIPQSMQAINRTENNVITVTTVPVPKPAEGKVLVQVYAVGLNPVDWDLAPVNPNYKRPPIPGRDVAGVVVAVGPGVTTLKVGDKVHGGTESALAEYVVVTASELTAKPKNFTFQQTAAIGLSGRTGLRMAMLANAKKDERVLIVGAAGGVGATALQVLHQQGAHVVADASSRHNPFLKSIGADEIINYDKEEVVAVAKDYPVVLNCTATENSNSLKYAKVGGLVMLAHGGIVDRDWTAKDDQACTVAGVTCIRVGISPASRGGPSSAELLRQLSQMADEGKYVMPVEKSFPFEKTADAMAFGRAGGREGKVIIDVRRDDDRT